MSETQYAHGMLEEESEESLISTLMKCRRRRPYCYGAININSAQVETEALSGICFFYFPECNSGSLQVVNALFHLMWI